MSARCQICGHGGDAELPMVGCAGCSTLHHLQCWRYLGHCSTYGCGSSFTEEEWGGQGLGLPGYLATPGRVAPRASERCGACQRPWKDEKGARCHGCGTTYHWACWRANGGCLRFACRVAAQESEDETQSLVSNLGAKNCLVCVKPATGGETVLCSSCGRGYHVDCWRPNRGCVRADCREQFDPALAPELAADEDVPVPVPVRPPGMPRGRGLVEGLLEWLLGPERLEALTRPFRRQARRRSLETPRRDRWRPPGEDQGSRDPGSKL